MRIDPRRRGDADGDPQDDDAVIPKAPETIGYTASSGCVRLTNWDAAVLTQRLAEGARVESTDIGGSE
jgi:hypothetical protein